MIGAELLRYDKERRYLCYDLETTGLNLGFALPWQVSYCVFTLDKIIEEHDFYIWWDNLPVSEGAARVTRFDFRRYQEIALPADVVLKSFEAYLYDPQIWSVAHNQLNYDSMIHALWRRKLGLKEDYSYLSRAFDTVALSKAYKKGIKPDTTNLLGFQYRMMGIVERGLKTNLGAMGKEFEIEFDSNKLHDALADIHLNVAVFRQLLWKLEI